MKNFVLIALCLSGCDTPTTGVVLNAFTDDTEVSKVWWATTLFPDPLSPGETSAEQRLVPTSDTAYALLSRKGSLIAVTSNNPWQVARSETLRIELAPGTIAGDCSAGSTLTPEVAEVITRRVFPSEFIGKNYDPATCAVTEAADAGP